MTLKQFYLFGSIGITICFLTVAQPVDSQIVPDHTTDTSIPDSCQSPCNITGGTTAGQNLFHSFSEFNINPGQSIYFDDPGVNNIFSRVTGNNSSQIFGTLGVSGGDANLFLLNPNGIVFGAGASLDLNGSFFATTADAIQFADGDKFSAIPDPQENLALLTVNPSALFFNQMGQNQPINATPGTVLKATTGNQIALLGAQTESNQPGVNIQGSLIQAPQGNIFLGAIAEGGTIEIDNNQQLKFSDNTLKGNIALSGNSTLDVSGIGAGSITLQGNTITLTEASTLSANTLGNIDGERISILADSLKITDNSRIITSTSGTGNSADISITTDESVELIGPDIAAFQQFLVNTLAGGDRRNNSSSVIYTFSNSSGKAGNIAIDSKNLTIANGAWILTSTIQDGTTGSLNINLEETLIIDGSGLILASAVNSTGSVNTLNLNSGDLILQNGGLISSPTLGQGHGGNINIAVEDTIHLHQSLPEGFLPTGIYSNTVLSSGIGGDITIDAGNLILEDGAQLSSSSGGVTSQGIVPTGGESGNISLTIEDSLEIIGNSTNAQLPTGILNNTFNDSPAGSISIKTGKLSLQGRGLITASAFGTGDGGNLNIMADDSVRLSGLGAEYIQQIFVDSLRGQTELGFSNLQGGFLTTTREGKAGDINISTPNLMLDTGAILSTSTFGSGVGGDLNVATENIEISASAITSSATGNGKAGNIIIEAERLTTRDSGIISSNSVGMGNGGDIIVTSDSIKLFDSSDSLIIPSGIFSSSVGLSYPGNITINTQNLMIRDGAQIDAANGTTNEDINRNISGIELPESLLNPELASTIAINAESIEVSGVGGSADDISLSSISTNSLSDLPASNIVIEANEISLKDRGEISVQSIAQGEAGNLTITTDSLNLDRNAKLNGTTFSGTGGNMNLQVRDILNLTNSSEINTNSLKVGDGGNIQIDSTFVIVADESNITANARSGQGGNINIFAKDLFIAPDSSITASSSLGIDGNVNITTFNTAQRNNLEQLPQKITHSDRKVAKSCHGGNTNSSVFTYTGKGGLPLNPLQDIVDHDSLIADFNLDLDTAPQGNSKIERTYNIEENLSVSSIIEAERWQINKKGKIELVAAHNSSIYPRLNDIACPHASNETN